MSILIPSTEPGVLEDIGSLLTYNPIVEAYEDCDRAMEHDGDAWREVWPEQPKELVIYDHGTEHVPVTTINNRYLGTDASDTSRHLYFSGLSTSMLDVTEYKKLFVELSFNEYTAMYCGLSERNLLQVSNPVAYHEMIEGAVTLKNFVNGKNALDISDIKGSSYIFLVSTNSSGSDELAKVFITENAGYMTISGYNGRFVINIQKIWLE